MPYYKTRRYSKKRARGRRSKKGYARRRYRRVPRQMVSIGNPINKKAIVTCRYAEDITIDPGLTGYSAVVFRANDCYDPNYSGVGHQPYKFDQFMTMYDHFTVIGSKITVTPVYNATTPPVMCGIALTDNTSMPVATKEHLRECGLTNWRVYGDCMDSGNPRTLTRKFSTKRFFSVANPLDNTKLAGAVNASPTECAYYHVWASEYGTSVDPPAFKLSVTIDYIVMFHEPKIFSQS